MFLFRLAIVAMMVTSMYTLRSEVARAHGEYAWIMKYQSRSGGSCCGPVDAVVIPHEVAGPLEVGSRIVVELHGVPVVVVVNAVHPTEDHEGRAWITRYGCLFKVFGV